MRRAITIGVLTILVAYYYRDYCKMKEKKAAEKKAISDQKRQLNKINRNG